jgi:hypothetical protein
MKSRWKFGIGQSTREEREEIEAAKRAGLVNEYLEGQRCSRLIEAEKERRRRREHKPVRRYLPPDSELS